MTTKRIWGLWIAGLLVGACGPSLQVRTDFDRSVNFATYRTFRLEEGKLMGPNAVAQSTLVKDRIDQALRSQLANEGMAQAGSDADLMVRYVAGARTVQELESAGYPMGPYGATYGDVWVQEVPEGMLVIDLLEARTDRLVWRAYVRAQGEGFGKPDFVKKAIAKAFEKYPPRA